MGRVWGGKRGDGSVACRGYEGFEPPSTCWSQRHGMRGMLGGNERGRFCTVSD